jgi:DNA polymerase-3 subunit epsilon
LDALMERHGISGYVRHRALGDAQVLREFWVKVKQAMPAEVLSAAIEHALLKTPRLPPQLPPGLADELPEGPGVYRYFGDGEALLYVGRSHSLRHGVLSQLGAAQAGAAPAKPRSQPLAAAVRRVEWLETPGELGALLREAAWLRQSTPAYNRRHKQHANAVTLKMSAEPLGRVELVPVSELNTEQLSSTFGLFRSAQDARKALTEIAHAHALCLKVLGLEESEGSCVAAQFGRCKGACTGKEPQLLHHTRTQMALAGLRLKHWPFPGRIGLRERGHDLDEVHVLDHWGYVGSARSEEELADLRDAESAFDVDVYNLLVRYFSHHTALDWHDLRR